MMKKHWPILFAIAAIIISIILGFVASNATDTGVAILVGVILFMFLFPLAGALIGGWYGWRVRAPIKWIAAPAVYLGVVAYLAVADLLSGAGSLDPEGYFFEDKGIHRDLVRHKVCGIVLLEFLKYP